MISNKEATDLIAEKRKDENSEGIKDLTDQQIIELMKQASAISEARAGEKSKARGAEMVLNTLARRRDDLLQDDSVKGWTFDMAGKDADEIEANFMQRAIDVAKGKK